MAAGARNEQARRLFAPLGPTYDRYAALLSFGQDPRWRRFLVSRVDAGPGDRVLDVATGTAAVAVELARQKGCHVVGVDQSPEMLAAGREHVRDAGVDDLVDLREGRAEDLPFEDASFDALTFTYLLRYVEPLPTLQELVRVVRPGGTVAMLEFGLPRGLSRPAWELYVRVGLPLAGRAISPGWSDVGRFLGPSIRSFHDRYGRDGVARLFVEAGLGHVGLRRLSLGGGLVVWGRR